jgi:hypothetical protein
MKSIYNLLVDHAVPFFELHSFQKRKDGIFKITTLFEKKVDGIIDCYFIRLFPDTDFSGAHISFGVKSTRMAKYIQSLDPFTFDNSIVIFFDQGTWVEGLRFQCDGEASIDRSKEIIERVYPEFCAPFFEQNSSLERVYQSILTGPSILNPLLKEEDYFASGMTFRYSSIMEYYLLFTAIFEPDLLAKNKENIIKKTAEWGSVNEKKHRGFYDEQGELRFRSRVQETMDTISKIDMEELRAELGIKLSSETVLKPLKAD